MDDSPFLRPESGGCRDLRLTQSKGGEVGGLQEGGAQAPLPSPQGGSKEPSRPANWQLSPAILPLVCPLQPWRPHWASWRLYPRHIWSRLRGCCAWLPAFSINNSPGLAPGPPGDVIGHQA